MQAINFPPIASLKPNQALERFNLLVGEWDIEISNTRYWEKIVSGHVSIQPAESGAFLLWRSDYEQPGPPSAISFIGSDESTENCTVLYYDVRGVSRVLQTTFEEQVWKVWRDAPGFSQRLTGRVGASTQTFVVRVEKSLDGVKWEHDFDMTYKRRVSHV